MGSRILKFTTVAGANLQPVGAGERIRITGYEVWNNLTAGTAANNRFLKFWFGNNQFGAGGGGFSSGKDAPTVGTDVPNLTIGCLAGAQTQNAYFSSPMGTGTCFVTVTANAADTDNTNPGAGDCIVNIFYE